jgi:putative transposase
VKYAWIKRHRSLYPLSLMCTLLTVSVNGFRAWLRGSRAPAAPNRAWSADLTYVWTDEGWLYLAVVLDLFNREVVGWVIKPRMSSDIVIDALTMAWFRRRPESGLIHHSDRCSQYASDAFQAKLAEYGMRCSMSRKGNCWDTQSTMSWNACRI